MATEDFETTYDSHDITGLVGIYNSSGIVNGGHQLSPASSGPNRQLCGRQASEFLPDAGLSLGAGNYSGIGFNPPISYVATPIPEFPTGGNLTGDAIYSPWAGCDVTAIQPVIDVNLIQPIIDVGLTQPVVDVDQLLTPKVNPLPASINTHGVADNFSDGKPACLCGKTFSRTDARARHIRTATRCGPTVLSPVTIGTPGPAGLFPCMLCDRHRGAGSFLRRDHLRQHLGEKGYHKMNKEGIDGYFRTYH